MKKFVVAAIIVAIAGPALAQSRTRVQGYVRKDGSYVAPHYRTAPDNSRTNNWSSQGNANPYTGRAGTVDPYRSQYPASGYRRDIDGDGQPD